MAQSASNHVDYVYSQAKVALDTHLDKIQVKTREIEASLNALQVAQARLNTLIGAGPDKIGIDETRKRYIDRYTKDLGEYKQNLHLRFDALTIQNSHQIRLDALYNLPPHARLHDHDAQVS